MTLKKQKPIDSAGDVRNTFPECGLWAGLSRSENVGGLHAVTTELDVLGARSSICGLVGRFVLDAELSAIGSFRFVDISTEYRCPNCHAAWLESFKAAR